MMNPRVLELLKNPDLLVNEDLGMISKEIIKNPYIQSLRALFLLGTNRFNSEMFHKELSTTAAYTTDKKILYQLINGKNLVFENTPENNLIEEVTPQKITEKISTETSPISKTEIVEVPEEIELIVEETPEVENSEETEFIEIISEPEIVEEIIEPMVEEKTEIYQEDKIIEKENIEDEKSEIQDQSQLSFHGLQEFLPDVKIESKESSDLKSAPISNKASKQDEEMKRLIAEVEAKMKNKKTASKSIAVEETQDNSEISFAETQSFEVAEKIEETTVENVEKTKEEIQIKEENFVKTELQIETSGPKSDWKPLTFTTSTPDSLLGKKDQTTKTPIEENTKSEILEKKIENKPEETEKNISEEKIQEEKDKTEPESNVPNFINTWQSWLKIERNLAPTENKTEEAPKEEIKAKAIEKFIENEPKISKLKEDSSYVIKEKKDDISHLMTETLANIYVEQRLYAKAIKAFEFLSQKHPEKTKYFKQKIQEVKEIRSNNSQ